MDNRQRAQVLRSAAAEYRQRLGDLVSGELPALDVGTRQELLGELAALADLAERAANRIEEGLVD